MSIKGDKDDPFSKGHICPKATALQDIYYDPDRLKQPVKKTKQGWQKITWNQAFDEVASKFKTIQSQYGHDSLAVYQGNPSVHNMDAMLFSSYFVRSLKTKNRFSATSVDQLPEQLVSLLMFGHSLMVPLPDLGRTQHLIIIGANPVVSNGSLMTAPGVKKRLKAIQARKGTVVVIDPRKTETATLADKHLFIKPGTDVLLLLAMLEVVFSENLAVVGRLEQSLDGLDLVKSLVKNYPPESVSEVTSISADDIRQMVRRFCEAESASCYGRIGVPTQQFGTLTQWLIQVFNIVTGNLDKPGGAMFSTPAADILRKPSGRRKGFADNLTRVRKLPDFAGEFPVAALAEEINTAGEGQIKALVTNAGNPVLSTPNGRQLDAALGKLDYMVSIDFFINETTRHADIILPPLSSLERDHFDLIFNIFAVENVVKYSTALFKAEKFQRSDAQILSELTYRMQSNNLMTRLQAWFKKSSILRLGSAGIINALLKKGPYGKSHQLTIAKLKQNPHGIHLSELQPCLPARLFTANKSINLAPQECLDSIQSMNEQLLSNNITNASEQFDLLLIGRRDPRTNNSWLHNSYRMIKGKDRCTALVNPQDALKRGVADGEQVKVQSRVGLIELKVILSDEMMPGVISIPHGWGHDLDGINLSVAATRPGVNTNILTDEHFLDSISGNAALNGVPVSLSLISS